MEEEHGDGSHGRTRAGIDNGAQASQLNDERDSDAALIRCGQDGKVARLDDGGVTAASGGQDAGAGRPSGRESGAAADGLSCLGSGWLIDEPAQLLQLYGGGGPAVPPLQPDRRLWRIATPYLMDQQAASIARQMETGEVAARRRRRPPPPPPPPDPVTAAAARLLAERAAAAPAPAAGPSAAEYRENNGAARRAAGRLLEQSGPPLSGPPLGANPSDAPRLLHSGARQYVLPARSRFLCGDVTGAFDDVTAVSQLLGDGPKFDCVLLDPPWSNKFVKRKRKRHERAGYQSLEAAGLARLPLSRLAADGALVAVWCTNSAAHRHTLRHTLLPAWGVQECAAWHWVKVTQYGEPVTPAGHHSKQPYELLVLGRRGRPPPGLPPPPADRLLVSVPCAVHSRKPLLHELLRPYLPPGYRGLEVFARGLLPGWTAWGDQPLLLQQLGALLVTDQQQQQQAEQQQTEDQAEMQQAEGQAEQQQAEDQAELQQAEDQAELQQAEDQAELQQAEDQAELQQAEDQTELQQVQTVVH